MLDTKRFPVQIQADNTNADRIFCTCMIHAFDYQSETNAINALSKVYSHVVAWDAVGNRVFLYDNR